MEESEKPEMYSLSRLNTFSYRQLQRTAKALKLPSNFKRVYLIELILAKKFCSDSVVESIIARVYQERKEKSLKNFSSKEIVQGTEITSTSHASPRLMITPHRYRIYNPTPSRRPKYRFLRTLPYTVESNRMLPSSNSQYQRHIPILNIDSSLNVFDGRQRSQEGYRSYNIAYRGRSRYIVGGGYKKAIICYRCGALNMENPSDMNNDERQVVPKNRSPLRAATTSQRRLSGISPLRPDETIRFTPKVTFRQPGRVSKIHAIIERLTLQREKTRHSEIHKRVYTTKDEPLKYTIKDVIDQNIDWNWSGNERVAHSSNVNRDYEENRYEIQNVDVRNLYEQKEQLERMKPVCSANYQIDENANNVSIKPPRYSQVGLSGEPPATNLLASEHCIKNCMGYAHSNSHHVPNQIYTTQTHNDQEEFSTNPDYPNMYASTDVYEHSLTELKSSDQGPLNVYQKLEAETYQRTQNHSSNVEQLPSINDVFGQFNDIQYKCLLQPLYTEMGTESGLYVSNNSEVANTSDYSANETVLNTTTETTVSQAATPNDDSATQPETTNSVPETAPKFYQLLKIAEQERDTLASSEGVVQNSYADDMRRLSEDNNDTEDDMEDALELISQDGDYSERVWFEATTRCVACGWAGPAAALETHLIEAHPAEIADVGSADWMVTIPLSWLLSREPAHCIARVGRRFYILSAVHLHGDVAVVSVGTTSVDDLPKYSRLVVYNKDLEPDTWEGEMSHVSQTTQNSSNLNGLKIDISRLDVLPAHLRLINGTVYSGSSEVESRVLNEINVVVYVSVFD